MPQRYEVELDADGELIVPEIGHVDDHVDDDFEVPRDLWEDVERAWVHDHVERTLIGILGPRGCRESEEFEGRWGRFAAEIMVHCHLEDLDEAADWVDRAGRRAHELVRSGELRVDHLVRRWSATMNAAERMDCRRHEWAAGQVEDHHPTYIAALDTAFPGWRERAAAHHERGWSVDFAARLGWLDVDVDVADPAGEIADLLGPWVPSESHPWEPEPPREERLFWLVLERYGIDLAPRVDRRVFNARVDTMRAVLAERDLRTARSEGIARTLRRPQ